MAIDILQHIRELSYQIWEQEGRPEGRHLDHWLHPSTRASRQVLPPFKQAYGSALSFEYAIR